MSLFAKTCGQPVVTGARQDSGLVRCAPRRSSRLVSADGFWSAVAPSGPRSETSRPLVRNRLSSSAIVPSACHSSKRRRQVGGDGYRPGNVAHPPPEASVHRTPFTIPRASTRGRPRRSRGTGFIWNKASTSAHSLSVKSSKTFIPCLVPCLGQLTRGTLPGPPCFGAHPDTINPRPASVVPGAHYVIPAARAHG